MLFDKHWLVDVVTEACLVVVFIIELVVLIIVCVV